MAIQTELIFIFGVAEYQSSVVLLVNYSSCQFVKERLLQVRLSNQPSPFKHIFKF